jgi:hypothetical protein
VIGKLHRLGLPSLHQPTAAQPRQRAVRTPIIRIVRMNGNSDKMRVTQSVTSTPFVCQDAADVVSLSIEFDALTNKNCHWPDTHEGWDGRFRFCGNPCLKGGSYCIPHTIKSRGNGTPSERAAHYESKWGMASA